MLNYTKAICSCVKFEIIIYYQRYHKQLISEQIISNMHVLIASITCSVQTHLNFVQTIDILISIYKIVEEFYWTTARFKNIDQSIVIKHRTNYSIVTINCSTLDKMWFFHTVSCFTNDSEFCKLQYLLKGLQVAFEYLDGEKSNLTEF